MTPESRTALIARPFPIVRRIPSKSWAGVSVGEIVPEVERFAEVNTPDPDEHFTFDADLVDWSDSR